MRKAVYALVLALFFAVMSTPTARAALCNANLERVVKLHVPVHDNL